MSSLIVKSAIAEIVGASFTAVTVNAKVCPTAMAGNGVPASVNVNVMLATPTVFETGKIVAVQFPPAPVTTMLLSATTNWSEETPTTDPAQVTVESTSEMVKATGIAVSSIVLCAAIAEITGVSFTALTVNVKPEVALVIPSVTVMTIFDVPLRFRSGVNVAVQFGTVPEKAIFPTGNNVPSEEVADK